MMLKLVAVFLACVTICQAGYTVYSIYAPSDTTCSGDIVFQFITTDPNACQPLKRSVQQGSCMSTLDVFYKVDLTNCQASNLPTLPNGWQRAQVTDDSGCAINGDPFVLIQAPARFINMPIAYYSNNNIAIANATLSCNSNGNMDAMLCPFGVKECAAVSIPNTSCVAFGTQYAIQKSCTAAPVAAPTGSQAPTTTTQAPVKAPAKASSATLLGGSAALVTLVALF